VKHWVNFKSISHPPHQISLCPLLAVMSVLLPCFNGQPDMFVVMDCSVLVLSIFSFVILTWSAESLYLVQ